MLPDFPKLKTKLQKRWNLYAEQQRIQHMGFLNEIPTHRNYEGNRYLLIRDDGTASESSYQEARASFVIEKDQVHSLTPDKVAQLVDQMSYDLVGQVERDLMQSVFENALEHNRLVDHQGRIFDKELYLDALNSIDIRFDTQGNPIWPTLVIGPELEEIVSSSLMEWNNDPDMQHKINNIINHKREKWRARESSRRLVE